MPNFFFKPSGKLPSYAEMQSFIYDSYVPKDEDMLPWNRNRGHSIKFFDPDYIDLYQYKNKNNIYRLRSDSEILVYQLGYFLAVRTSGKISFQIDDKFISINKLKPLFKDIPLIKDSFKQVEKLRFLLPEFFTKYFNFMQHRVTKKLYRFDYYDEGRRVQGACSNMDMPLTDWVGKGDQSVLNFKSTNLIHGDFFAFVLVSYLTQEWFFVMWQVNGRRFWFGDRNSGIYHNVDFVNTKSKLEELIQQWDFQYQPIFYFDGQHFKS